MRAAGAPFRGKPRCSRVERAEERSDDAAQRERGESLIPPTDRKLPGILLPRQLCATGTLCRWPVPLTLASPKGELCVGQTREPVGRAVGRGISETGNNVHGLGGAIS